MSVVGSTHGTAPHGSPRTREILAIGAQLIEQHGHSATTVNDIADKAGMLPGSLYHRFASKEAIALALLDAFDADLLAVAQHALHQDLADAGPAVALTNLCDLAEAVVAVVRRHAAAVRIRAYEPPLAASSKLRGAVRRETPTLGKAWSEALHAVLRGAPRSTTPPELLRFAFHRATWRPPAPSSHDTATRSGGIQGCAPS